MKRISYTVTLKINGTIGDGEIWKNPSYELKTAWYGYSASDVRNAMLRDGYQTNEQPEPVVGP